jgi:hypothetical protein
MQVTFKANANFMGYKAGKIYTEELTPMLKAALLNDRHLSLIDPPSLEVRRPVKEQPEAETETKKKSGRKPVENTNKENDENESERESDEGIQDSGSTGTA